MTASTHRIRVAPGQPIALQAMSQNVLQVRQGRVWLTQSDDPNDYFLEAGESMTLSSGRLVMEAESGLMAECLLSQALPTAHPKPLAPNGVRVFKVFGAS